MNTKKRVIVIAAHPDDEILGCGGTIARLVREGYEVQAVIVCEGESVRYGGLDVDQRSAMIRAAELLGYGKVIPLGMADQRLDGFPILNLTQRLETIMDNFQPSIVFTHYANDLNRDHRIVFEAVATATRPVSTYVEALYQFQTASSSEWAYSDAFQPNTWVDISQTLPLKIKAFEQYTSEVRVFPHPRSTEALEAMARVNGAAGMMEAAEVFILTRRMFR